MKCYLGSPGRLYFSRGLGPSDPTPGPTRTDESNLLLCASTRLNSILDSRGGRGCHPAMLSPRPIQSDCHWFKLLELQAVTTWVAAIFFPLRSYPDPLSLRILVQSDLPGNQSRAVCQRTPFQGCRSTHPRLPVLHGACSPEH